MTPDSFKISANDLYGLARKMLPNAVRSAEE